MELMYNQDFFEEIKNSPYNKISKTFKLSSGFPGEFQVFYGTAPLSRNFHEYNIFYVLNNVSLYNFYIAYSGLKKSGVIYPEASIYELSQEAIENKDKHQKYWTRLYMYLFFIKLFGGITSGEINYYNFLSWEGLQSCDSLKERNFLNESNWYKVLHKFCYFHVIKQTINSGKIGNRSVWKPVKFKKFPSTFCFNGKIGLTYRYVLTEFPEIDEEFDIKNSNENMSKNVSPFFIEKP